MKNIFLLSILSALLFSSCTEVISVDTPPNPDKLVVEGYISSEQDSSYVLLSRSVSYFEGDAVPEVIDAIVTVNGIAFNHIAHGRYIPASPYKGVVGSTYTLRIVHQGKEYGSVSTLEPMYDIDTVIPVFKQKEGFIKEGYTVTTWSIDNRPRIKYTMLRFGFNSLIDSKGQDSLFRDNVLFDNRSTKLNERAPFELPFLRLKQNDTAILVFRSIDFSVNNYYMALEFASRGRGGPFSTPPANLPTNVTGGALGVFAAHDVKRFRTRIQ